MAREYSVDVVYVRLDADRMTADHVDLALDLQDVLAKFLQLMVHTLHEFSSFVTSAIAVSAQPQVMLTV